MFVKSRLLISQRRSCLSKLLIYLSIIEMIDKGFSVDIIYLDLQNALDKVPHDILMHKIRNIGIICKIGDWIEEWLSNRKQRVVINGSKSEWSRVECPKVQS